MRWDPDRYLTYAAPRLRPGLELLARVPDVAPRRIVDLGCGPGNLTARLAERWPDAAVVGIDSSPEMLARARRDHPRLTWVEEDITAWQPNAPVDLVFSNSTLHWLDDHETVFPRLRSWVAPGGVIAVQMPDNWREPTHRIPADILDDGTWPVAASAALLRDRVSAPESYAGWMQPGRVDMWRTTYYEQFSERDPVWNWYTGSLLRPVLEALEDEDRQRFIARCQARYVAAYPPGAANVTTVPMSRLFLVTQAA
jgi:trans-aconitate 2-methyltransferase